MLLVYEDGESNCTLYQMLFLWELCVIYRAIVLFWGTLVFIDLNEHVYILSGLSDIRASNDCR